MRHVQIALGEGVGERDSVRRGRLGGKAAELGGRKVQDDAEDLDEVRLQTDSETSM